MDFYFDIKQFLENVPIFGLKIPKEILAEIDVWICESKKIKSHPLYHLKAHENVGYDSTSNKNHNAYQCGIFPSLIENSFWLPYTLRACSHIFGGNHRNYKLRKWDGHFDGYDIWVNFSYLGNENPTHNHAGHISGIIYYQNHNHPTIFPDYNIQYVGDNATMLLFPSNILHRVNPQEHDEERITLAFNIEFNDAF
jgi:hypothetical protein